MNNKEIPKLYIEKKDCCGCGACSIICPVHAITLEEDEEGFLYPKIDETKCIKCHSCIKICPLKTKKEEIGD